MQTNRKYNDQTRCYKIDLFIDGTYYCSTDQSKTCKEAIDKLFARCNGANQGYPKNIVRSQITAYYYKNI